MHLLSTKQTKMDKSVEFGYLSTALQLEPAYELFPGINTCPMRGVCAGTCIGYTGQNRFDNAQQARLRRTHIFRDNPELFFALLDADLHAHEHKANKLGLLPTARLNCLSDISWETYLDKDGKSVFERHPGIQFLDYTKILHRAKLGISNYYVTYSVSERTDYKELRNLLTHGGTAAVVFNVKKGQPLPESFKVNGKRFPVYDGDTNDLIHLAPPGSIRGLRYKMAFSRRTRRALKPSSLFVLAA